MVDNREEKRISLRVTPELHEKIATVATSRNLSINAFIIQALESAVDPDGIALRISRLENFANHVIDIISNDDASDEGAQELRALLLR